jgi:alpha-N-arabinofuranosidase
LTTELLGKTMVSGLGYENPDGSPIKIDTDYFGARRSKINPSSGPFEAPAAGMLKLKAWQND